MNAIWSVVGVAGLVAVAGLVGVAGAQTYTITDLQPGSGFDDAFAYGVSQNGKITGTGTVTATGELHAFVWDGGVMTDLGMFGYPSGADGVAINNSGQIAATGYGPGWHALLYSNGHITHIAGSDSGPLSEGLAINNLGHVVGRVQADDGGFQPFQYFGSFATLPLVRALGINDLDQIAGSSSYVWVYGGYGHEVEHACVLTGTTVVELGDLGGGLRTNSASYSINGAGQVAGYSTRADGSIHAFRYSPGAGGGMSDLGTFGTYYTYGVAINAAGDVAGNIQTYVGGQVGVFLYAGGAMHNLADLLGAEGAAWDGLTMTGMNDAGWIVGYGTIGGATHGFVARPAPGGTCGSADFNGDGDIGTDADIEAFFACLSGDCCATCDPHGADFNGDGDVGTDADIEAFFRVLAGGAC